MSVAEPQAHIAASAPNGSPTGLSTLTLLPLIVELRIVAVTPLLRWIPPLNAFETSVPPSCSGYGCGIELVRFAALPSMLLSSIVSVPLWSTRMPPAWTKRPNGPTAAAELPVTREWIRVRLVPPRSLTMPPPSDCTADAWLSLTVVSISVIVPQLSMPAASPKDAGHGAGPGQTALTLFVDSAGDARLPVMTLRAIVTVVPWNASMPPPSAVASA